MYYSTIISDRKGYLHKNKNNISPMYHDKYENVQYNKLNIIIGSVIFNVNMPRKAINSCTKIST